MSNATQQEGRSGNRNRNRSRGGKGRNQQQGQSRNNQNRNQSRDYSPGQYAGRPRNPKPQPIKLSWWQKLLKSIGLYKEPRQSGRPAADKPKQAVRSNTRVATGVESGPPKQRGPREAPRTEVDSPRLYVGNLSYEAAENDLEDLFKGVGSVRSVEVIYNRNTHRSKGYAFVEMLHLDEAKRAVEVLHDQPFMGRKLLVSGAKSKEANEDEASRSQQSED